MGKKKGRLMRMRASAVAAQGGTDQMVKSAACKCGKCGGLKIEPKKGKACPRPAAAVGPATGPIDTTVASMISGDWTMEEMYASGKKKTVADAAEAMADVSVNRDILDRLTALVVGPFLQMGVTEEMPRVNVMYMTHITSFPEPEKVDLDAVEVASIRMAWFTGRDVIVTNLAMKKEFLPPRTEVDPSGQSLAVEIYKESERTVRAQHPDSFSCVRCGRKVMEKEGRYEQYYITSSAGLAMVCTAISCPRHECCTLARFIVKSFVTATRQVLGTNAPEKVMHLCFACGRVPKKGYVCKRCKHAVYCDATCQRAHWPIHRVNCVPPPEERGPAPEPPPPLPKRKKAPASPPAAQHSCRHRASSVARRDEALENAPLASEID